MIPSTREEAAAINAVRYNTGKPCRNGHTCDRYTSAGQCVDCHTARYAKYVAKRPGWLRETNRSSRLRRLGISEPTRPEPKECELCNRVPTNKGGLHLDHDHQTGAFRGWLCADCNTSVGKLGDSIEGLERAIRYLRRAQQ